MGMQLPDWARKALEYAGCDWPSSDEEVISGWATEWRAMQTTLQKAQEDINAAIQKVGELNDGPGYQAFTAHMAAEDSTPAVIGDSATGCGQMAIACEAVATIVLGLKILVLGQLATLAAAIAAAVMSGGLAAGGVVLARKIAVDAITTAVTDAVAKLLEE